MDYNLLFDDYKSGQRPIIVTGFSSETTKLNLDRTFVDLGLEVERLVLVSGGTKAIVYFREKSKYRVLEILHRKPVFIGGKKLSFQLGDSLESPTVVQINNSNAIKSHSIHSEIKISLIELNNGAIVIKYWKTDELEQMESIKISTFDNENSTLSRFPAADRLILIKAEVSGLKTKYFRSRIVKVLSTSEATAYLIDVGIETKITLDNIFTLDDKWTIIPPIIRTGVLYNTKLKCSFGKSVTIDNVKAQIKIMDTYYSDEIGLDQFERRHIILFDSKGNSMNDLLAELGITEPCTRNLKLKTADLHDSVNTQIPQSIQSSSHEALAFSESEVVIPKVIRREQIEIGAIYEARICYKDVNFVYLRLEKHHKMLQDLNNLLQLTFAEKKSDEDLYEIDQLVIFCIKDRKTEKLSYYRGKITKSETSSDKKFYHVRAEDVGFSTRVRPKMITTLPLDSMKYPSLCIPAKTSLSVPELKSLSQTFKVSFYYNNKSELHFSLTDKT